MAATIEDLRSVERLIEALPPKKLEELIKNPGISELLEKKWLPNPGPQTDAYNSLADELFYGGRAGPGKTDVLFGLAITAHKMSLILRRTNKEASRMITRFAGIVGHRDGWNSQQGTFTFSDGKLVEFGGCQLEDDKQKFKGDPHDLICVGRGTPVMLADGSYCAVEKLRVGQMLTTLEGPKKLERVYPSQRKECVEVTAVNSSGRTIAKQVQSSTHVLLSGTGVTLGGGQSDVCESSQYRGNDRPLQSLLGKYEFLSRFHLKTIDRFWRMAGCVQRFSGRQYDLARHVYAALSGREIYYAKFGGDSVNRLRPPLSFSHQGLQWPFVQSGGKFVYRPFFSHGDSDVHTSSLLEDYPENYLDDFHPCDEHIRQFYNWEIDEDGDQECLLLSFDVEQPIPNGLKDDVRDKIHRHNRHTSMYAHPYTKEIRQVAEHISLVSASLKVSPAGVHDVFDIQVEEVRHYITFGGFINKNCFDEIADFSESQYRFIGGWNRSADKGQRCRIVCCGNPPTTPEGYWVKEHWAPWLDPTHPNPAKPGELRWFTTIAGKDQGVDGPGPHDVDGEQVMARSRTFIPGELKDNPDLLDAGYGSVTAALPPGLREAYHEGRFDMALDDDVWQTIPTAWIMEAQDRWEPDAYKEVTMTAVALDPAGGGKDAAVFVFRYGTWFAPLVSIKGKETRDGSSMAGIVLRHRKHGCPVIVDVGGGYAGAVIERFKDNNISYQRFDGAAKSNATAVGSGLKFANKRAEAWWRFREALDPDQEGGSPIALPMDSELIADLAAPRYENTARGILLENKDHIRARIGRSPDRGDAVVMCLSEGNKAADRRMGRMGRIPKIILGYAGSKKHRR